ncbi:helix-turn-helix domain-containing protein [Variovorax sp. OK605]|uniref:MarR family transcriptional regulator n=1 Tax=Variovorax sp. OK605 TaxID=1855317 RepID=UPI00210E801A|nr:helix-turn-helix domain-containing protein [Variovorax sp. OK605]
MGQLIELLGVTKQAMHRPLKFLQDEGYVVAERDANHKLDDPPEPEHPVVRDGRVSFLVALRGRGAHARSTRPTGESAVPYPGRRHPLPGWAQPGLHGAVRAAPAVRRPVPRAPSAGAVRRGGGRGACEPVRGEHSDDRQAPPQRAWCVERARGADAFHLRDGLRADGGQRRVRCVERALIPAATPADTAAASQ